jgi:hypothetical protein
MDFALYEGLQNKSNIFEVKAQNRQMEMQILQAMDQRSEMKLAKQAEIDAKMQEYYNSINELDVLEQDKERISATEKMLRGDVINKVIQYNGNLQHFMYGGGAGTLQAYQNNLMESEAVKGAIANKTNKAQWDHAQANGLWVKDVGVEVPTLDPETGEMVMQPKKVSMNEAWELFEKGVIDKLPYDGAEKDIDVGPEFFQKIYKDPRNPYSQDTAVTPQDVYTMLYERGASDEQARFKANKYAQMLEQGATQWRYKSGDPMKLAIQKQQLANMRQKHKMNKQQMNQNLTSSAVLDMTARVRKAAPGEDIKLYKEEQDFFFNQLGITYDKEKGTYTSKAGLKGYDRYSSQNENPASYDLRSFETLHPEGYHIGPNGEVMLKFRATTMSNDEGPISGGIFGGMNPNEGADVNNWKAVKGTGGTWGIGGITQMYEGNIYVPVTDYFTNEYDMTYLNQEIGVRQNAYMTPYSAMQTNDQRSMQYANDLNNLTNLIMNSSGANYDQSGSALYQYATSDDADRGGQEYGLRGAQAILEEQRGK